MAKGSSQRVEMQDWAIIVYCDSNNAIQLPKNQVYQERTKHIDVKLHFVREEIIQGSVKGMKVSIDHNSSNMITKFLLGNKFCHCLDLIQLIGNSACNGLSSR